MTVSNSRDSEEEQVKILLLGLDNSGKTSILTCLKGVKNIAEFSNIRPTRGDEYENFKNLPLNKSYTIVDLGGQKAYRNGYLNNFTNLLVGVNKIIYVIDIQDKKRYEEAFEYLSRVMHQISNPDGIDFSIFLHKFDSDFTIDADDLQRLIRKIKQVTPPNFRFSLQKTTIYATFEKTNLP